MIKEEKDTKEGLEAIKDPDKNNNMLTEFSEDEIA